MPQIRRSWTSSSHGLHIWGQKLQDLRLPDQLRLHWETRCGSSQRLPDRPDWLAKYADQAVQLLADNQPREYINAVGAFENRMQHRRHGGHTV